MIHVKMDMNEYLRKVQMIVQDSIISKWNKSHFRYREGL